MTDSEKIDPANALGFDSSFAPTLSKELGRHGPQHAMSRSMLSVLVNLYSNDKEDWLRCAEVLRPLKVLQEVKKEVRKLAKQSEMDSGIVPASEDCVELGRVDPSCPAPELELPAGYRVDDRGRLMASKTKMVEGMPVVTEDVIAPCLLVIARRLFDLGSDDISLDIAWPELGTWHTRTVSRGSALVARKLGELAAVGVPVTSSTASKIVDYLAQFESHNRGKIPTATMSRRLGWHSRTPDPSDGAFVLGSTALGGGSVAGDIVPTGPAEEAAGTITHCGTLEKWQAAVAPMASIPNVQIALCAALAAPLVAVVQRGSAIIEWAASTSRGKTTLLKLAESCWGDPDQALRTWDTTQVALERVVASRCDLPLVLDDTATAPRYGGTSIVQPMAYHLISGRSKSRGKLDGGVEKGVTWRTVVLTTGEKPIAHHGKAEGASARVLSITAEPLGQVSKSMGEKIEQTSKALRDQYGTAGPAFLAWLTDNRDQWTKVRQVYDTNREMISKVAPSGVGARAGHAVGLLAAAAWVGRQSGVLPWVPEHLLGDVEMIKVFGQSLEAALEDSDRTHELDEVLHSTWQQNRIRFHGPTSTINPPQAGWMGQYDERKGLLNWYPEPFKRLCKECGLSPKQACTMLAERGVLVFQSKPGSRVVRVDGGTARVYSTRIKVEIDMVDDEEERE